MFACEYASSALTKLYIVVPSSDQPQRSTASFHLKKVFVEEPRLTVNPALREGAPATFERTTISASSTVNVSVLSVVVLPKTVRLPVITASLFTNNELALTVVAFITFEINTLPCPPLPIVKSGEV